MTSVQTRIAIFTLCLVAVVSSENTALQRSVQEDIHLSTQNLGLTKISPRWGALTKVLSIENKRKRGIHSEAGLALIRHNPDEFLRRYITVDETWIHYYTPETKVQTELISKYGYKAETHTVKTEDGYILKMHRIPGDGPPVFLQHGLLCSSADWVVMGPGKSLAYILADAGYDVWMGNARGTSYSKKHVTRTPSERDFWDFSWHEMGIYDLPAEIDYVLENTGKKQLYYIGHSMGTTMFYVMASELPFYGNKIRAMFSLAPVAYMSHLNNPFVQILSNIGKLAPKWENMGMYKFPPYPEIINEVETKLCKYKAITQSLCSNMLFLIAGYDSRELNMTMLPVILGHVPQETSTKTFLHYGQEVVSGKFRQYDISLIDNKKVYGTFNPLDYNVSRITAPVALHYSLNDWLSSKQDVTTLEKELPNLIGKFLVPDKEFNHVDYLYAIHAKEKVYQKVMELMKNY